MTAPVWDVAPVDVPRLRREQVAYCATPDALDWNRRWTHMGMGIQLGIPPEQAAQLLTTHELHRLRNAELFYVAPDMVDLVQAAYSTMPEFAPQRSDLPAEYGLMVFGKPLAHRPLVGPEIDLYRRLEQPVPVDDDAVTQVIAVAWGLYDGGPRRQGLWGRYGGGLFVNFYAGRELAMRAMMAQHPDLVPRMLPPLIPENEASFALYPGDGQPTPYGFTEADYVVHDKEPNDYSGGGEHPGYVGPWTRMLLAAFTLMRQPGLAQQHTERAPRHERRRGTREGIPDKDVQVVHLRRLHQPRDTDDQTPADQEEAAAGREWHHQWIVRGHWRNQAYGVGRALRRPKWIAPYTKGPDDKPLKGGEKVNVWDR